ncbi:MAG: hypothetical protein KBC32_00710 [Candidatus Didemnitutus sp.]|nr:hypothetical protein [Candidatus Didemnitutus sp.]
MSTLRQLQERRAELTGLRLLLGTAADEEFEKPLLLSKITAKENELQQLEREPTITAPETELLFGGRAVDGSLGIDAKFASAVLESFQDMVSNHYSGRLFPGMSREGRRPGEQESRLFLSALPRGSFGLKLTQPQPADFVVAQHVGEAMEELTTLVEAAASGDATFAQGVERFHPRVLVPLRRFLDTLANREATVTIRSGQRETQLSIPQVQAARTRVAATIPESDEVTLRGVFRGVLLESWKFDFVPDGALPISGALADSVTDEQAQSMVALCDRPSEAHVRRVRFRTHGNVSRPTYELLALRGL